MTDHTFWPPSVWLVGGLSAGDASGGSSWSTPSMVRSQIYSHLQSQ